MLCAGFVLVYLFLAVFSVCSSVLRSFARLKALFAMLCAGFVIVYLFLAVLSVVLLASLSMSMSKMAPRWLKNGSKTTSKWL